MKNIKVFINKKEAVVPNGSTIATAIFNSNTNSFRRSIKNEKRFPLCGMGVCFECRVSINGVKHQRSCQILAQEGMEITTDE